MQLWRRADIGLIGGLDNLAGNRTRRRFQLIEIGFEKAPLHLGVVGECLAGLVRETDQLALILGDILFRTQVKTEIIAVLRRNDIAVHFRRADRRGKSEKSEKEGRKADDRTQRHKVLPLPLFWCGGTVQTSV